MTKKKNLMNKNSYLLENFAKENNIHKLKKKINNIITF